MNREVPLQCGSKDSGESPARRGVERPPTDEGSRSPIRQFTRLDLAVQRRLSGADGTVPPVGIRRMSVVQIDQEFKRVDRAVLPARQGTRLRQAHGVRALRDSRLQVLFQQLGALNGCPSFSNVISTSRRCFRLTHRCPGSPQRPALTA